MYKVRWSARARKDATYIELAGLKEKVADIIGIVERDPKEKTHGQNVEKIECSVKNTYTRRIDYHNRFVYCIKPNTEKLKDKDGNLYDGIVRIVRMWGHHP